ncbi:hypothetical protein [uncultured Winogradskyella sp.]|uniref:mechanosensitive ion channel family protein n=1 Tax=uncultured Winogradskyella sp. TaxID=395353 RepID=UPI00262F98AF|nr:hypothetical protein [uncultured Winogradskyella sp.]
MEKLNQSKDYVLDILASSWPILAKIVMGILGLIVALYIIKIIVKIIIKLLNLAKAHKLDEKINDIEIVEGKKLNFDTIKSVSTFIKYVLYVILVMIGAEFLGLEIVSKQISDLISYTPKLVSGIIIFVIGLLFANFVKNALKSLFDSMDLSGAKMISQIVFFLILIFMSITALNQAEIDTQIITQNLTLIIGAFLLAFAIAFGFGARVIVGKLMHTFYARKMFEVGQKVIFNGQDFIVDDVKSVSIILKNSKGRLIVPINDLMENQVQLQD